MAVAFAMRVSAAPQVLFRAVGEESVLLDQKTGIYFGVDPVGTRMWLLLTGSDSIQSAFNSLLVEFDVSAGDLHRDLDEFVNRLLEGGLIELQAGDPVGSTGSGLRG